MEKLEMLLTKNGIAFSLGLAGFGLVVAIVLIRMVVSQSPGNELQITLRVSTYFWETPPLAKRTKPV